MSDKSQSALPPANQAFPVMIITGISGSGKSTALRVFEDMGFLTVDGMPVLLAPQMAGMFIDAQKDAQVGSYKGLALGMDIRHSDFVKDYDQAVRDMRKTGLYPQLLFLDAKDDVLVKRYATTRRPHPLEKEGLGLEQALDVERQRLKKLRKTADLVLDTSTYSIHDLRRAIQAKWSVLEQSCRSLRVHIISFGFKYGTPAEADMVFDLRFLPNPFFIPELKPLSGQNPEVAGYVLNREPGQTFLTKLIDFLDFVLKEYESEGRYRLTIAIGCTGGRHRSVAVAEAVAKALRGEDFCLSLEHRHLELG